MQCSIWLDLCKERANREEQEGTIMHLNQSPRQAQQEAFAVSGAQTRRTETRLRRRVLVIAQTLWLLIALFEVGVLLVNLPAFIALLHTACSDPTISITGPHC